MIKIATWNTDNPKTTNQILEDVADIEENFQELHDVIHAITNGTLGTTTAANFRCDAFVDASSNAMAFPTNNPGAATIMVGDNGAGNNTMWMYLNAAPTGWKVSATGADTVLAISGGAGDYNVNGGNPDSAASWEIDGFTAAGEAAHTHAYGTLNGDLDASGTASHTDTSGSYVVVEADGKLAVATGAGAAHNIPTENADIDAGATAAGSSHTHAISHDSSYRPSASVGKLFDLDTA